MKNLLLLALLPFAVSATEIPRDEDGKIERSHRTLVQFQKLNPCPSNGNETGACSGYVKDHIRPLCAGGHDAVENLKWSELGYSKLRDKQEWQLCRELKKKFGTVKLDQPLVDLCVIIDNEDLALIKDICTK